jgi:hypothetical protein
MQDWSCTQIALCDEIRNFLAAQRSRRDHDERVGPAIRPRPCATAAFMKDKIPLTAGLGWSTRSGKCTAVAGAEMGRTPRIFGMA